MLLRRLSKRSHVHDGQIDRWSWSFSCDLDKKNTDVEQWVRIGRLFQTREYRGWSERVCSWPPTTLWFSAIVAKSVQWSPRHTNGHRCSFLLQRVVHARITRTFCRGHAAQSRLHTRHHVLVTLSRFNFYVLAYRSFVTAITMRESRF